MAKGKKGYGVTVAADYRPKSRVTLEGSHASEVTEHPIGRKVKFTVHATKTRHEKNFDGSHSAAYDIHKIEMADNKAEDNQHEDRSNKKYDDDDTSK